MYYYVHGPDLTIMSIPGLDLTIVSISGCDLTIVSIPGSDLIIMPIPGSDLTIVSLLTFDLTIVSIFKDRISNPAHVVSIQHTDIRGRIHKILDDRCLVACFNPLTVALFTLCVLRYREIY